MKIPPEEKWDERYAGDLTYRQYLWLKACCDRITAENRATREAKEKERCAEATG